VLKEYTDEFKALIRSVNSRTAGRQRLRQGVWVTEVTPISLPKYLKTKQLRCFVMRMRGNKPWAVITNDEAADLGKLPQEAFDENACWVYLTAFSYNLFLSFKMTIFGVNATQILHQKLSTLRRQIIDLSSLVRYARKIMILEFEKPPPLMEQLLSLVD
jgi:hypothetical protein